MKELPELRKSLRSGACKGLEGALLERLENICAHTLQLQDVAGLAADHLQILQAGLQLFPSEGASGDLQAQLKSWSGKMWP